MNVKFLIVILLLLLGGWDFSQRIVIDQSTTSNNADNLKEYKLPNRYIDKTKKTAEMYLANSTTTNENEQPSLIMSRDDQLAQQGELDLLYSGDLAIYVKAVIDEKNDTRGNHIFSIVQIENLTNGEVQSLKVEPDQELFGYKVQNLELKGVGLVSIENKQREVFLTVHASPTKYSNKASSNE